MSSISIYDDVGEIVFVFDLDDDEDPDGSDVTDQIPAGGGYIPDAYDPEKFYVVGGLAVDRPTIVAEQDAVYNIVADGIDAVTIPCPAGTWVEDHHDQTRHEIATADDLVITATLNGEFLFTIEPPFPNQIVTIKVIANVSDI